MTTLLKTASDIKKALKNCEHGIGFVPTMGALHAGHISLLKTCKEECKTSIVSIFVNPLQFSPGEDFEKYPRTLEDDLKICKENNIDYVFAPEVKEIYLKENEEKIIPPESLTKMLCGLSRKDFFPGVATVVKKLLDIVQPDYAFFGEKDLQQLYTIRWLVKEFKLPVFVRACPIVREKSGLAYSSRNKYLTEKEKEIASNLYKALQHARRNTRSGMFSPSKSSIESLIYLSQFPEIKVEYFEARSKDTLEKVSDTKSDGFYFLIAAKIGDVRLIDNIEV